MNDLHKQWDCYLNGMLLTHGADYVHVDGWHAPAIDAELLRTKAAPMRHAELAMSSKVTRSLLVLYRYRKDAPLVVDADGRGSPEIWDVDGTPGTSHGYASVAWMFGVERIMRAFDAVIATADGELCGALAAYSVTSTLFESQVPLADIERMVAAKYLCRWHDGDPDYPGTSSIFQLLDFAYGRVLPAVKVEYDDDAVAALLDAVGVHCYRGDPMRRRGECHRVVKSRRRRYRWRLVRTSDGAAVRPFDGEDVG